MVVDSPGLGAGEGEQEETAQLQQLATLLNTIGHINAFIIVLKSGQSRWAQLGKHECFYTAVMFAVFRFLAQHQQMFQTFQNAFGEIFWKNSILDVSHRCDMRNKKNLDSWLQKLRNKFPAATNITDSKVFIDAPEMENDTLEEFYALCQSKQPLQLPCFEFHAATEETEKKNMNKQLNSSLEDFSQSSDLTSDGRSGPESPGPLSRPGSRLSLDSVPAPARPRSSLALSLPPLPGLGTPRSPRLRRVTAPGQTSRSLASTPRLPRASLSSLELPLPALPPGYSPGYTATNRLSRRLSRSREEFSFSRETSPVRKLHIH